MLSEILAPDRNSFNLVRLAAAVAVLISHVYVLRAGPGSPEPLSTITPFTLGQHAVNAFFFISGLTLSFSLARNPSLLHFAWARVLRVMPGLFVFGVVFAFVAGPALTSWKLVDYFADARTWLYPFSVIVQFAQAAPPHGIFSTAPFFEVSNDPLWTIKYELAAYAGLALLQLMGLLRTAAVLTAVILTATAVFILTAPLATGISGSFWLYHLSRYGFCFLIGALAFNLRNYVPLSPWLLLVTSAIAVAAANTKLSPVACIMLVAHLVVVVGAGNFGPLTRWTRTTDISYGTYIYGWPVQQFVVVLFPAMGAGAMLLCALVAIFPLAFLSWTLVEKPALELKRVFTRSAPSRHTASA